jgi:ACS family hexuronate transporter-like MFS transporter
LAPHSARCWRRRWWWAILHYNWQSAFVITGALGLVWVALWLWLYDAPTRHRLLSKEEAQHIAAGQEQHQGEGKPSMLSILKMRNFWGIALPRFLADPAWGTLSFWVPLYLTTVRHFDLAQIAMLRGCRSSRPTWLHVRADGGAVPAKARRAPDQRARGAFTLGVHDDGVAFVGLVESPYAAIALLSLAGFAHQTLSVTVITMSSDLFRAATRWRPWLACAALSATSACCCSRC